MPTLIQSDDPLILALDPGGHTGFAVYRQGGLPEIIGGKTFSSGEVDSRYKAYAAVDSLISWGYPLEIVAESFTINSTTAQKSPQLDALYIIGAVDYLAHKLGCAFHLQAPAKAKAFADDRKLKALGWYVPGQGHANDAARHLLSFMVARRMEAGGRDLLETITAAVL